MIPITVHVPQRRVEEFYIRFGEFVAEKPDIEPPLHLASGNVPRWVQADGALPVAQRFLAEVSGPGLSLLRYLVDAARTETASFTPQEWVEISGYPKGPSGIAGVLGQVGKAVRRANLPMYRADGGNTWHYVWDWDGERYSMTPEVARLLRKAWPR